MVYEKKQETHTKVYLLISTNLMH